MGNSGHEPSHRASLNLVLTVDVWLEFHSGSDDHGLELTVARSAVAVAVRRLGYHVHDPDEIALDLIFNLITRGVVGLEGLAGSTPLFSIFYARARRRLIDQMRKEARRSVHEVSIESGSVRMVEIGPRVDDEQGAPLSELTPSQQHVVSMRVEGARVEEIAADLGITPRAVYARQQRARNQLALQKRQIVGRTSIVEAIRVVVSERFPTSVRLGCAEGNRALSKCLIEIGVREGDASVVVLAMRLSLHQVGCRTRQSRSNLRLRLTRAMVQIVGGL